MLPGALFSDLPDLSPAEREIVANALEWNDGRLYDLHAYVVMNDHVHVLVQIYSEALEKVVHNWKSFTANRLQRLHGRPGRVWLSEYFDRIVRDDREFAEKRDYILANPLKRWPDAFDYKWVWAIGSEG